MGIFKVCLAHTKQHMKALNTKKQSFPKKVRGYESRVQTEVSFGQDGGGRKDESGEFVGWLIN